MQHITFLFAGELIGIEYLFRQSGRSMGDIVDNMETQAAEEFVTANGDEDSDSDEGFRDQTVCDAVDINVSGMYVTPS